MKTRLARQLDTLRLRGLARDAISVLEPTPLDDARPLTSALLVPGGEKVWIANDCSGVVGAAQARPRRYVLGWELLRILARRDLDQQMITAELVQDVLQYLQDRGIPRLFARTSEGSHGQDLLIGCGFTALLTETILVRQPERAQAPAETPSGLRYRMPQDDWPLRQLESGQTPQLISQLEGLTSANWSMPRYQVFRNEDQTDLIIERDGEIVGWAGWTFVGSRQGVGEHARLSLLTDLDQTELALALVDYALYSIYATRSGAQVIVRLRDYQDQLRSFLEQRDFVDAGRETVLIKHGRLQVVEKSSRKLFELAPARRTALSLERSISP